MMFAGLRSLKFALLASLLLVTVQPLLAQQNIPADAPVGALQPGSDVKVFHDLPYITGAGKSQSLDLFIHTQNAKPAPLIIWIHGGGWVAGDKSRCPAIAGLAQGYDVASINYRLSTEAVWPAQIQDCLAAIRFLRANSKQYNIDPDRFGVWGASAGGHLAALIGTAWANPAFNVGEHLDVSAKVQAICDWFGPIDLVQLDTEIVHKLAHSNWDEAKSPITLLFGFTAFDHPAQADTANPIKYLASQDPPFLIMHGTTDPIVPDEQSTLLADALRKAGVPVTLQWITGGHGTGDFFTPGSLGLIRDFFADALLGKTLPLTPIPGEPTEPSTQPAGQ